MIYRLFHKSGYPQHKFALYLLPLVLVFLADSTMSYSFPVIVESELNSNVALGIVMSISSATGILWDLLIPKLFPKDSWSKMLILGIMLSLFFPIFTVVGAYQKSFFFFILATVIWGIYYELISFTQQDFIVNEEQRSEYSKDWSILSLSIQFSALAGSILGASLLQISTLHLGLAVAALQSIALVSAIALLTDLNQHRKSHNDAKPKYQSKLQFMLMVFSDINYWKVLFKNIYPLTLLIVAQQIIFSTYWTLGGLLGIQLADEYIPSWIVLALFNLALISSNTILTIIKVNFYRSFFSRLALILGGLLLLSLLFIGTGDLIILPIMFVSSMIFAVSYPLNESVMSEISNRSKDAEFYVLGLARASVSIVYIIWPLVLGILSDMLSYQKVFAISGLISASIAMYILFRAPRRIVLPQKALNELTAANKSRY